MATTYDVQPNQSYKDVVLQCLGSMEAAGQFCQDNDVSFTSVPPVGAVMIVSDAAIALAGPGGANVVATYIAKGTKVGTLNTPTYYEPPGAPLLNTDDAPLLNTDGTPLLNT